MIDTVGFACRLHRREPAARGWKIKNYFRPFVDADGHQDTSEDREEAFHERTGIRTKGTPDVIESVECSLPRVLFGHNGKLITTKEQVRQALRKVQSHLDVLAHRPDHSLVHHYLRVDVCWQVRCDVARFLSAHRSTRHPYVRRTTAEYHGETLTWPGKEMRLTMYDKIREITRTEQGDVLRVEVRLRGRKLRELLSEDGESPVDKISVQQCYEALRSILLLLQPQAVPREGLSIGQFLALLTQHSVSIGGVSAFDTYCAGKSRRQARRLAKEMAASRVEMSQIDWSVLLPEGALPAPVHIEDHLSEQLDEQRSR